MTPHNLNMYLIEPETFKNTINKEFNEFYTLY